MGMIFLLNSKPQERERGKKKKKAIPSFEDENWSSEEDPKEYANIQWSSKDPKEYANIQWSKKDDVRDRKTGRASIEAIERELGTIARNFPFFLLRGQESSFRTKSGKIARARDAA
jgi:hypothetical protein